MHESHLVRVAEGAGFFGEVTTAGGGVELVTRGFDEFEGRIGPLFCGL